LPPLFQFRSKVLAEISCLKHRPKLDLGSSVEGSALKPFHRLVHRPDLPNPIAGDEFLRFSEWSVNDRAFFARESHPLALRGGMQSVASKHHSRLYQLLVVFPHLGKDFRV